MSRGKNLAVAAGAVAAGAVAGSRTQGLLPPAGFRHRP